MPDSFVCGCARVGVWGPPGSGKTTLARAFCAVGGKFGLMQPLARRVFVCVGDAEPGTPVFQALQRQLLRQLADVVKTGGNSDDLHGLDAARLRSRLQRALWAAPRLLLVLDDVRSRGQLTQAWNLGANAELYCSLIAIFLVPIRAANARFLFVCHCHAELSLAQNGVSMLTPGCSWLAAHRRRRGLAHRQPAGGHVPQRHRGRGAQPPGAAAASTRVRSAAGLPSRL